MSEPTFKRGLPIWAIIAITALITVLATTLVMRYYFFPSPYKPIELNIKEEQKLNQKLQRLIPGYTPGTSGTSVEEPQSLTPEPYSELGVSRDVHFSEREVNALLSRNTDLADKLAVDLAADLLSAKLLVPLEPDFPIMGGKTVRINAGMKLAYTDGKPIAMLKGVSVMGVPIPNAWLGNLKNIDLIQEFGDQTGFWQSFADGIEYLQITEGKLEVKLKE